MDTTSKDTTIEAAEPETYYPDSGIDDNNWRRILAVGKA
jgi:hypothetical protein